MRTAIDRSDQTFLEELHRMCGGTIQDICDSVGVTATAVRQRLNRLEGLGLVVREVVRAGRGRPHHVYRVSDAGFRQLGENYRDLALVLWRAVHEIEDLEVRAVVLAKVHEGFVGRLGRVSASGTLPDRVRQLQEALSDHGFNIEVGDETELTILRERSCPYSDLASTDPSICEMEQGVFSRILNARVSLTQRCVDGHGCCEFRVEEATNEVAS
jgi:predicted ArsR family transcriptional regulator